MKSLCFVICHIVISLETVTHMYAGFPGTKFPNYLSFPFFLSAKACKAMSFLSSSHYMQLFAKSDLRV